MMRTSLLRAQWHGARTARHFLVAACALLGAVVISGSCADAGRTTPPSNPTPPGYSGPYPSPKAQGDLKGLAGKTLAHSRLAPDGGDLVFESFAVVPNPVTGKGPVVCFVKPGGGSGPVRYGAAQGEGGRFWLPVLTDGDAADLVERLTGAKPAGFGGDMSPIYRATLGL